MMIKKEKRSEQDIKEMSINSAFENLLNDDCPKLKDVGLSKISDELIECYEQILNRDKFGKLDKVEAFNTFENFSNLMAEYVGVEKAEFNFIPISKVESYLTKMEYSQIGKHLNNNEHLEFLKANLNNREYAFTEADNSLTFYYYTDLYYAKVKQKFDLTDAELKEVVTDDRLVSSMRHEYQHIFQLAKVAEYLGGKPVENRYAVMGLYTVMKIAVNAYKKYNGIGCGEETTIDYFFDLFEIDARLSELSFVKSLLKDERVSQNIKNKLIKFSNYYIDYNFNFKNNAELKKLMMHNINYVKSNFEKFFKEIPMAQSILKIFNELNIEKFCDSIERQKDMCIKAFSQLKCDDEREL